LGIALTAVVALSTVSGAWPAAIAVWLVIAAVLARWPWPAADAPADLGPAATPAAGPKAKAPMLQNALIATVVVATMTTLVPILGAHLAGIITSAPIILSFLLPGTHRARGGAGAAAVARGTIISMVATVAFSTVLATSLERFSAGPALLIAAVVLGTLVAATATVTRAAARVRAPARP
ncbi:MAG: hypothetical protein FWD04_04105, partial [Conexibacteraceae bacterium]|nr:hypothetical protein [Conexibacteraceae bacterium]